MAAPLPSLSRPRIDADSEAVAAVVAVAAQTQHSLLSSVKELILRKLVCARWPTAWNLQNPLQATNEGRPWWEGKGKKRYAPRDES